MSESHPGARRYNRSLDDFGALEGTGPACQYERRCDAASVYAAVHPGSDGVPVKLCPYHLGLYREDHPEHYQRLEDAPIADPEPFTRDDRFYRLADVPERIRNGDFRRIGLDHRGVAHYFGAADDERTTVAVLRVDRLLDLVSVECYSRDNVELGDYLERVEDRHGWVGVDDDVVAAGREVDPHE